MNTVQDKPQVSMDLNRIPSGYSIPGGEDDFAGWYVGDNLDIIKGGQSLGQNSDVKLVKTSDSSLLTPDMTILVREAMVNVGIKYVLKILHNIVI